MGEGGDATKNGNKKKKVMVMMIANDSETKHTHTNKRFKWKGWIEKEGERVDERGGESSENHLTRRERKRIE